MKDKDIGGFGLGECYTISRFSFKRSDAHNALVFLVTPGENDDRVLGQVTVTRREHD